MEIVKFSLFALLKVKSRVQLSASFSASATLECYFQWLANQLACYLAKCYLLLVLAKLVS